MESTDIAAWVQEASAAEETELRQAVHTILTAIARDPVLREGMVMKGGILLAVRYHSRRFTKDIDFSTAGKLSDTSAEEIAGRLSASLRLVVEEMGYNLDCQVQSFRINPQNRPEAKFPSIELKIGHARKGAPKHKRLQKKESPSVVSIDYSLNEVIHAAESVEVGGGGSVRVYDFAGLVAEKFRSLLQQAVRNRFRRQDVFDLSLLVRHGVEDAAKRAILESLMDKARARGIEPCIESLADAEVKRRAAADYPTLKDEVAGELPEFEASYAVVEGFYRSLPWPVLRERE